MLFLPSRSLCTIPLRKLDFRFPIFALPVVVPSSITKNKILDYLFLHSQSMLAMPLRKIRFSISYFCTTRPLSTIPLRRILFSNFYFCPPGLCAQFHCEKLNFRFHLFALQTFVHNPITENLIFDVLFLPSRSLCPIP